MEHNSDHPVQMPRLARVGGRLKAFGPSGQQANETRYAWIAFTRDDGSVLTLPRVIVPGVLDRMLEIGGPVGMYLARKGPWHFCYAVEAGGEIGESYDGYRLFYVFNRVMMFINLMAGVFLMLNPGLRVAGAGLFVFGVLFAWFGPPTIGAMRRALTKHRNAPGATDPVSR